MVILQENIKQIAGIAIVPIGLAVVLVPLSLLGWNVPTLILFWFVLTPLLVIYLPALVTMRRSSVFEPLTGLVLFYGVMVFMIYKHYDTDYFKVMIISLFINVTIVLAVTLVKKRKAQIKE